MRMVRTTTNLILGLIVSFGVTTQAFAQLTCTGGPPPPSGMIAWWTMDETSGIKAVDIISGMNGTINPNSTNDVSFVHGRVNGAFHYYDPHPGAGLALPVEIEHDPRLNFGKYGDFTIDAWIWLDPAGDHHKRGKQRNKARRDGPQQSLSESKRPQGALIFAKGGRTNNVSAGYSFGLTANERLMAGISQGNSSGFPFGGSAETVDPISFGTDGWAHVAVRFDRDADITFFMNGLPVSHGTSATQTHDADSDNTGPAQLGWVGDHFKNMKLDEVEIYNRALTDAEIAQIAQQGKCKPIKMFDIQDIDHLVGPVHVCVAPPPDMDAWYPFDGDGRDLVLGKSAVPLGNIMYFTGKVADAVIVSHGRMSVPHSPVLNQGLGDFSMDAWIKFGPQAGVREVIEKRLYSGGTTRGYLMYLYNNRIGFQLADGANTNYNDSRVITDDQWHHVAITVDRDNPQGLLIYVDGVAGDAKNPTGRQGNLDNKRPTYIGKADSNIMLDEVEFFDRVLTPSEILGIYDAGQAGKCKPGPIGPIGPIGPSEREHADEIN